MKNYSGKRWVGMLAGNMGLAIGVCIFRLSGMGNDPFSGVVMSLAALVGVSYGMFLMIMNCFVFLFEFLLGRKYIGPGTFVNWFLIGIIVDFLYPRITGTFGTPQLLWQSLILLVVGVLVTSFSVSVYQGAKAGISPYDSSALIIQDKTKLPYFWCRISLDSFCAMVCFLTGGIVGLGTLACALGLGPFIAFFDRHFTDKWMKNGLVEKKAFTEN